VSDRVVVLDDLATGHMFSGTNAGGNHGACVYLAFSPDGNQLATVHFSEGSSLDDPLRHSICLWKVNARKQLSGGLSLPLPGRWRPVPRWIPYRQSLAYLAFSPDGTMLAGRLPCDETIIWDTATGRQRKHLATNGLALAFGPDNRTLISVTRDGAVQHWDVSAGYQVSPAGPPKDFMFVDNATASSDGAIVALADGGGCGAVKSGRNGALLHCGSGEYSVSSDGKTYLCYRDEAVLFDAQTGKESGRLEYGGKLSPDGKLLAKCHDRFLAPSRHFVSLHDNTLSVAKVDDLVQRYKPKSKPDRRAAPLEATLVSHKESYVLDLGGRTAADSARMVNFNRRFDLPRFDLPPAPEVDLELTLRNVSDESISISDPVTIRIALSGDGAMNHPEVPGQMIGSGPPTEPRYLAPGETCTIAIESTPKRHERHSYWLLPGEYTLYATCSVTVSPVAKYSYFKTQDGSSAMIDVEPAPLRLKVVAAE
jgi:hypothetical protein